MPFYRKPSTVIPLAKTAEKKAIKNNLHYSIFTSRFDRYKGEWDTDRKQGKGLFQTITGKLYEGDWYNGYRHGFGTLSHRLHDGTTYLDYRGWWVRGKPEGAGWWYYENGDVYFGYWRRGHRDGFGKMWYANGTLYVGYWVKGLKQGLGMFVQGALSKHTYYGSHHVERPLSDNGGAVFAQENGNRYEGHWENNIKSGIGRFYHMHTGQLQEGCWINDLCVRSKMSDIIIRQFCDLPTPYPIRPDGLAYSRKVLEESELWLQMKVGDIDKNLQICIDQM